jgi:Flp pilus assembly pilin Flp
MLPEPTPIGGDRMKLRSKEMHNLVEKYTPAVEASEDDGVVAIEYVLVAGLVAIGVAITFGSSLWTTMLGKLNGLFT